MVAKSLLPKEHPEYIPLYLSNDYNRVNRGIAKFLRKFNWFIPGSSKSDNSWKSEIPDDLKPKSPKLHHQPPTPQTVLFVPNSNQGILLKRLQEKEPQLMKLSGYSVSLVEASGSPLSRLFSLDLSDGRCYRADCLVCLKHTGNGSSIQMSQEICSLRVILRAVLTSWLTRRNLCWRDFKISV